MSQFGHSFDKTYIPINNEKYKIFVNIYNNPLLTKTKELNGISTYMGTTMCMLINECRYLVAMVPNDSSQIGTNKKLDELYWTNFQTRTLKGKFECNVCGGTIDRNAKSIPLELKKRTEQYTQYESVDKNFIVSLLHTRKDNLYEYPNEGDLISALEMYHTIVSFE